jgi:hypothetical protein
MYSSLSNHLGDLIANLSSAQKRDYEALFSIRQVIFYKQPNFVTTNKATSETSQPPVSLTALAAEKRDYEHFQQIGQVLFRSFTSFFAKALILLG